MSKSFYTIYVFVKLSTRRFFRDRLAIFFGVLFPLIFLFVFGGIFGRSSDISFRVAVINQSKSEFSSGFVKQLEDGKIFKIDKEVTDEVKANEKMSRGEIDATIVLPENFGQAAVTGGGQPVALGGSVPASTPGGQAVVRYTQNNEAAAMTMKSVLDSIFKEINARYVSAPTPFTVKTEQSNERSLSRFDYVFAGLLGFSIIGLGIFGPVNVFPELKKQGILRRLHTTPLKVWEYFVANALSQAIIGLFSIAIMFIVALTVFNLDLVGNIFELTLFIVLGITMILGIGLAVGGWASNERQAAPLANIVVFPMMFLSGTFFPRYAMPQWLQKASDFLPLTPVIDGIRLIATEGKHLTQIGPQLGMIALWGLIIYIIAFLVFRWE